MDDLLYFDFNEKSSTLLIFFFNAVVFSFLLFKKGFAESRKDCFWLGSFLFLCGLYICPFMLGYANWYAVKPYREILFFVPFQQLFLLGPVLYMYVLSLLHQEFRLSKKQFVHFVPAILYMGYSVMVFITDKFIMDEFYFYADGRDKDLSFWYQMAGLVSMFFYLILSLKSYGNYKRMVVEEVSFADEIIFVWMRNFLIAFGTLLMIRVLFFILNPEWGEFGSKYWYYLCFSLLFFYIAIAGYSNAIKWNISLYLKSDPKGFRENKLDKRPLERAEKEIPNLDEWQEKITMLVDQQKIYTDAQLTLSDVAKMLNTNRNVVSTTINKGLDSNFNDFINQKRVEAVIEKFERGEHHKITLLAIALESGFNSKTTFNRAFKKHTSLTPLQYIAKNSL